MADRPDLLILAAFKELSVLIRAEVVANCRWSSLLLPVGVEGLLPFPAGELLPELLLLLFEPPACLSRSSVDLAPRVFFSFGEDGLLPTSLAVCCLLKVASTVVLLLASLGLYPRFGE